MKAVTVLEYQIKNLKLYLTDGIYLAANDSLNDLSSTKYVLNPTAGAHTWNNNSYGALPLLPRTFAVAFETLTNCDFKGSPFDPNTDKAGL